MQKSLNWAMFSALLLCLAVNWAQAEETSDYPLLPLYQYRPTYFLVGHPDTKIQISLRAKMIRTTELYVAYTQLMMWDLFKPSAPFRDLNYNPEIFYRLQFNQRTAYWLDLGFFEHESNGRDGAASRSWDRTYLRYHSSVQLAEKWELFWSLKAWVPYRYDVTTPDFARYRGVWEFEAELRNIFGQLFESDDLTLRLYPGGQYYTNPWLGGQELTLRGKIRAHNFLPYVVVQVFHGYGEDMIDYKQNRFALRAGLGF